jgi:hypothetical protein
MASFGMGMPHQPQASLDMTVVRSPKRQQHGTEPGKDRDVAKYP